MKNNVGNNILETMLWFLLALKKIHRHQKVLEETKRAFLEPKEPDFCKFCAVFDPFG